MLNKLCKVLFFINLLLVIVQSYASHPPLPPSLPAAEVDTKDKDVRSSADISFFDKLKQFFSKPKKKDIPPKQANEQTKAAHQEEQKLASQEPNDNEQAEPFIDVGNTALPSTTSDNVHTNPSHESSVNLASHDIQESNEAEASEPFIDIGSATLPSVTSNEMHEAQVASNEHNGTNLAANSIIPNVPRPIVSMPPAQAGSYVVPPQRPVQIYKPTNLPPVYKPIPLNPHPDANKEEESVAPIAPPSITNIPAVSPPVVSPPVTQDNTSSTMPITVPPAVLSNVPAPSVMPTNQPSTQPITPTSPNTPVTTPYKVIPTTDSSAELNNSQETFVAVSDVPKKQDWNTPLIPVVVVKLNQPQPLQINNNQTTNNQEKSPPASSPNVTIQKQDNNVNNETLELVTKFVKDETQMLFLPDDDIVLGKLTEQATLEQMDMYAYIELFQKKAEWIASAERRKVVESFIKYDNDINKKKDIYANLSYCSAVENAFRAVDRNNLFGLRALLDVYPILQEKGRSGETLLTAAIYNDNYYLAKFLVIRGIKISTLNDECQYPLDIALAQGNTNIACMLIKAKGY
ncbi:MAG TPA: ankyrin repeat domain-containing protein [Rickettsia endosymbiont of Proechinophthirus fluctus]|uniref:ankyrin repeat domain-containing protein n=1 Tax=Rickettsia endosymbiont of Proechinophthirus fluctus TaxID=1462733 RepID=UPI000789F908|nr:ankyrin repeat domain-containing protein [Rickettsia endosymbiont of Proechinophthirus fluctus]KYP97888.1 ankyrin [Rickettsia endosymbiont of Proechinophthirus fluctus]HJD54271.1 ankyrin repeat domain-containing protein [Rickettsia endosymbiont of Proechinophthirus fluctus]